MPRLHLSDRARKFLREVGSIVLGVLIALGIGEIADSIRHRVIARKAVNAVYRDMATAGTLLEERMINGRCVIRHLEAIRAELIAARRTGRLRNLGAIGNPHVRLGFNAAWTTLSGSGELLYVPPDDLKPILIYFTELEVYLKAQDQEQQAWGRLQALQSRPGPLDDNLATEMEVALLDATTAGKTMNLGARQLWLTQMMIGIPTNYSFYNDTSRAGYVAAARADPICRPL